MKRGRGRPRRRPVPVTLPTCMCPPPLVLNPVHQTVTHACAQWTWTAVPLRSLNSNSATKSWMRNSSGESCNTNNKTERADIHIPPFSRTSISNDSQVHIGQPWRGCILPVGQHLPLLKAILTSCNDLLTYCVPPCPSSSLLCQKRRHPYFA